MNPVLLKVLIALQVATAGIVVGFLLRGARRSGRTALVLCLIPFAVLWTQASENPMVSELGVFGFLFSAPLAGLCSWFSWRKATDRKMALAAFIAGIVVSLIFLTWVGGLLWMLAMIVFKKT